MSTLYEDLTCIIMYKDLHSVLHRCRMQASLLFTSAFLSFFESHEQIRKIKLNFIPFKFHEQKNGSQYHSNMIK
jgi:hypothetical protein